MTTQAAITTADFIAQLDSYEGDNIWMDVIYGTELSDDVIDQPRTDELCDAGFIWLESGASIRYSEASKEWFYYAA